MSSSMRKQFGEIFRVIRRLPAYIQKPGSSCPGALFNRQPTDLNMNDLVVMIDFEHPPGSTWLGTFTFLRASDGKLCRAALVVVELDKYFTKETVKT